MSDMTEDKPPELRSDQWSTLRKRASSTLVLVALLGGVVIWGNMLAFQLLVCLFCAMAAWEWAHMLRVSGKPGQPWLSFSFGIAYPVLLTLLCPRAGHAADLFTAALAPAGLVLLAILSFIWEMRRSIVGSRSLRSVGNTVLSFIFPVWMFSFAVPMMLMDPAVQSDGLPYGVNVVIWVVLYTKFTDIFAYISGMLAGGRIFKGKKLIPHISPKKTWEGLIGSFVLSVGLGGWLGVAMDVLPGWHLPSIVLMVLVFILAVFGDLAGSLIKRSLAVKDSGSLLPGIGGVFDLIDSPAFTLPFVFYLNIFLHMAGSSGFFG